MSVNENDPVKCADCSVWWRGLTHKCSSVDVKMPDGYAKDVPKEKKIKTPGCPKCGITGWHSCVGAPKKYLYNCHFCKEPVDYRYSHNCHNGTSAKNN